MSGFLDATRSAGSHAVDVAKDALTAVEVAAVLGANATAVDTNLGKAYYADNPQVGIVASAADLAEVHADTTRARDEVGEETEALAEPESAEHAPAESDSTFSADDAKSADAASAVQADFAPDAADANTDIDADFSPDSAAADVDIDADFSPDSADGDVAGDMAGDDGDMGGDSGDEGDSGGGW